MDNKFLTALGEHAKYIGSFLNKLREDSNEQFNKLRMEVRESKQNVQVDITPRAIEELQNNANININKAVQSITQATNQQTDNLAKVTQAISRVTDAINTDTSEAYLLRQSLQKLDRVADGVEKLVKEEMKPESKDDIKKLDELKKVLVEIKDKQKDVELAPVTNGLKMLVAEIQDMSRKTNQGLEMVGKGLSALAEVVPSLKTTLPKTWKLDEQQVRKLSNRGLSLGGGSGASGMTVANVALANSGTEYFYTFPANTVSYTFKLRTAGATLYYAFAADSTPANGSAYVTLLPGLSARSQDGLEIGGKTIYFETDTTTQVVEIEVFTLT